MSAAPQQQTALDEQVVDDELLEQALEARERARVKALDARKALKKANDSARGHLERHKLEPGVPLRVGRFVVTAREIPGSSVAFETAPSTRVTINTVKDDGALF